MDNAAPYAGTGRITLWLPASLPLAATIILFLDLAAAIHGVNAAGEKDIPRLVSKLQSFYADHPGLDINFDTVEGKAGFWLHPAGPEPAKFIPIRRSGRRFTIFAFGESSLVMPPYHDNFPMLLEDILNERRPGSVEVLNFGYPGFESVQVKGRVMTSLRWAIPDLILLYFGHNDYLWPYRRIILQENYSVLSRTLVLKRLLRSWFSVRKLFQEGRLLNDSEPSDGFDLLDRALCRKLQSARLVAPAELDLGPINALILRRYRNSLQDIIAAARSKGVPVLLAVPIGNLEHEPTGIGPRARALFAAGMNATDYKDRMRLLTQAQDLDALSYYCQAKSQLKDMLRGLDGPGVFVLDLPAELELARFRFGNEDFTDSMHMTAATHRLVAQEIAKALLERPRFFFSSAKDRHELPSRCR